MTQEKTVRFRSKNMRAGWTAFPNLVLLREDLTAVAKTVYVLLCHYAGQDESAWPGQELLHTKVPTSERTLRDALRLLERASLIHTVRRGRGLTNVYEILEPNDNQLAPDDRQTSPVQNGKSRRSRSANTAGLDRQQPPIHSDVEQDEQQGGVKTPPTELSREVAVRPDGDVNPVFDPQLGAVGPRASARLQRTQQRLAKARGTSEDPSR